ncbi:glycoside hydrolase family 53 protein [Abyssalbus ytuae]|uniref:Arabinogalactan endo-beta-1,4-galactanase n=1 Tax=Abyssalbus ytuae TaxID=2926907 RepID=A0A9E7D488_9FLAO|nr:arabinogalactan endo-1,4-beta-galactosidase [Abyssalbus ytuae]UOB18639.1 arabinogalactan endo-1,4-beta-galactosidase [Abyssalbus ytuae]
MKLIPVILSFLLTAGSCSSSDDKGGNTGTDPDPDPVDETKFYLGADLSYVNEMEDCGAVYKNENGTQQDPFVIFKNAGTNLVRVRLWHNPDWTQYSDYDDVKETIKRAKNAGMEVLLDFHYSDDWADPSKQEIPAAWVDQIDNTEALGNLLYDYTYETLNNLSAENLLPEFVQVGNEINGMILQQGELKTMDWARNSSLLNKGIKAVRDISAGKGKDIGVMLHIAQPENALWWFEQATSNGVTDFDLIGLSYYPIWSEYDLKNLPQAISTLVTTYKKRLMVVETAYPFTMENADSAGNILGTDAVISGYPATQQGQYDYLVALHAAIKSAGGEGLIYWEPAWVSTGCSTQWGQGSHWDNATLFDHNNQVTKGMEFYNASLTN